MMVVSLLVSLAMAASTAPGGSGKSAAALSVGATVVRPVRIAPSTLVTGAILIEEAAGVSVEAVGGTARMASPGTWLVTSRPGPAVIVTLTY